MKLLLVVNPVSGGIDKTPFVHEAEALCRKYGIELYAFKTDGINDEKELQGMMQEIDPDKVAVAGGDGTVLVAGLLCRRYHTPMGIIPLGSANGMASEMGVAEQPLEALKDLLLSSMVKGLDMLVINEKHSMIHIGDVGINARIIEQSKKEEARGMTTYIKHFIREIGQPEAFDMEIEVDGKREDFRGVMVAFCNARKYGTEMPITATGNPMDGVFEIAVIEEITMSALFQATLTRWAGFPFEDPEGHRIIKAQEALIRFKKPRLLQVDGEIAGTHHELQIKVVPNAIPLITNANNPYLKPLKTSQ